VEEHLSPPSNGRYNTSFEQEEHSSCFLFFRGIIMSIENLIRSVNIMNEKEWIDIEAAYTNQKGTIIVNLWALPLIGRRNVIPAGGTYYFHR
jgi:hypothetical protein